MRSYNMLEAKSQLSKLVDAVESGAVKEIVISRNGKPAARVVALAKTTGSRIKLGLAKGRFSVGEDFDAGNSEIAALFVGKSRKSGGASRKAPVKQRRRAT